MKRGIFLPSILLILSPTMAHSQQIDNSGPYVALTGQATFFEDTDIESSGFLVPIEFDTGIGAGFAGGYAFGNGIRAEAEATYRVNDINFTSVNVSGEIDSMAYMLNVYYDFGDKNNMFIPYIGGGLGATDVEGESYEFSYQAMAGLSSYFTDSSEIFAGYRYFAVDDISYRSISYDLSAHAIELGLRFRF